MGGSKPHQLFLFEEAIVANTHVNPVKGGSTTGKQIQTVNKGASESGNQVHQSTTAHVNPQPSKGFKGV